MRTLKFRVWSKVANRFLHSHKNKGLIFGMGSSEDSDIEEFGGWDVGSCVEDKNLVVQQFTGLLDKNGNPIYEGDIVKGLFLDTDIHHWEQATVPVVWVDRVAGFNLSSDTWDRLSIEVVGNVFDRRIQERIKMAERLKDRKKPNLDEVDFGTPHWKEE